MHPTPPTPRSNTIQLRQHSSRVPLFDSFFLGGFEGSTGLNMHGEWFDQIAATAHDTHADDDYRRLRSVGLLAARDSIRWPLVDRRGRLNFDSAQPLVRASNRHGIRVIWDLFHYGYPEDLDPFGEEFVKRFAEYCHAAAHYISSNQEGPYFFTPVNEPSFLAWASAEVGRFAPHCHGRGPEMKVALVRAAIAGTNAIWAAVPDAHIVSVDPLCHVVAPHERMHPPAHAADFNQRAVFEAWDMIAGRTLPELGGSRAHLGIVGVNYYWTNQWEIGAEDKPLPFDDPRRIPLARLLRNVWKRYGGDLLITETAHVDDMRPIWMHSLADTCHELLSSGVPLRGACLYPIVGMPEWHERQTWTRMGLWDIDTESPTLRRVLYEPMHEALQYAQALDRSLGDFRINRANVVEPTGESIE